MSSTIDRLEDTGSVTTASSFWDRDRETGQGRDAIGRAEKKRIDCAIAE
jgi:hypothetical protein